MSAKLTRPAVGLDTFLRHLASRGWTPLIAQDGSIQAVRGTSILLDIGRRGDRVAFRGATVPEGIEVWPDDHEDLPALLTSARPIYTPEVLRAGLFERSRELDSVRLPLEVERYLELDAAKAMKEAQLLENSWVVLLNDPDFSGWSPWCVIAPSYEDAVREAVSDWWRFVIEPGPCRAVSDPICSCPTCAEAEYDPPELIKAYRGSWIGERVDNLNG